MVSGPLRSILTAERTALNFLGHLSGVATLTRRYVMAVQEANPGTRVLDTRKTTPGLRALEKAAVRAGGGHNHRGSLSEAVLVKDNHRDGVTVTEAVARAKDLWPGRMVEVECDRTDQVAEAVAAGASVVMLDNMGPAQVAECVALVRAAGHRDPWSRYPVGSICTAPPCWPRPEPTWCRWGRSPTPHRCSISGSIYRRVRGRR